VLDGADCEQLGRWYDSASMCANYSRQVWRDGLDESEDSKHCGQWQGTGVLGCGSSVSVVLRNVGDGRKVAGTNSK